MKEQYQIDTGLWVIAECVRCGRGFIRVGPKANGCDPYAPQRGSVLYGGSTPCGGRLLFLDPNPANPDNVPVLQHE